MKNDRKILLVAGLLLLPVACYLLFSAYASGQRLIPLSVVAMIAGVVVENKRIAGKWAEVLRIMLLAFICSFLAFLPGKRETIYSFDTHIRMWPYVFLFFAVIYTISFNKQKVTPRLTEGITLLQSIALTYWVIDYRFLENAGAFTGIILLIGLIFSFYALYHAFSPADHSRNSRFALSIWSSVIILLLAIDYIIRVFNNGDIEDISGLQNVFVVTLQYFLLGISSIYIARNFMMLSDFLPGRGTAFNSLYFKDIRALENGHISRYSESQVNVPDAAFCVVFCAVLFSLNHYLDLLPANVAIWLVFVIFPYVLTAAGAVRQRKGQKL